MVFTLLGVVSLAYASTYPLVLVSVTLIGIGSSIFHPDATRSARYASGGRHGLAQGIFQVGGQIGGALGPLLAAFIIVPRGQTSLTWFVSMPVVAMALLAWTAGQQALILTRFAAAFHDAAHHARHPAFSRGVVGFALAILTLLMFSKLSYMESFRSFYTFYLIEKFGVSVATSQMMLFVVFLSSAAGVLIGGVIGDRIGRYRVIWISILGPLPLTLILPYADLFWTGVLTVVINLIMASAFASILIYAMELVPRASAWSAACSTGSISLSAGSPPPSSADDRQHRHRKRLPDLLVPAGGRSARVVPAEAANRSRRAVGALRLDVAGARGGGARRRVWAKRSFPLGLVAW